MWFVEVWGLKRILIKTGTMDIWDILFLISLFMFVYLMFLFFSLFLVKGKKMHYKPKVMKDEELPSLSVVIPLYNEGEFLHETLKALLNSNYPKEKLEIIVVDDKSTDNSRDIAKQYERFGIKVIENEKNMGAARTKNNGLKHAHGELIAFMDSDSVVERDTLRKLASYFRKKEIGAVTATIRVYKPKNIIEKAQAIEYDTILFMRRLMMLIESVYVTPGGLSMFRRNVVEEVGGFDYRSLTEDLDIALKIQWKGYKIRAALDAIVYTKVPSTLSRLIKQRIRWVRGGIWSRINKRYLVSPKYGDFVVFGMLIDLFIMIPSILLVISIATRWLRPSEMWIERLGLIEYGKISLISPLTITSATMTLMSVIWVIYMVNVIRRYANQPPINIKKEWAEIFIYAFLYSYMSAIVWPVALYKELIRDERGWGTR